MARCARFARAVASQPLALRLSLFSKEKRELAADTSTELWLDVGLRAHLAATTLSSAAFAQRCCLALRACEADL